MSHNSDCTPVFRNYCCWLRAHVLLRNPLSSLKQNRAIVYLYNITIKYTILLMPTICWKVIRNTFYTWFWLLQLGDSLTKLQRLLQQSHSSEPSSQSSVWSQTLLVARHWVWSWHSNSFPHVRPETSQVLFQDRKVLHKKQWMIAWRNRHTRSNNCRKAHTYCNWRSIHTCSTVYVTDSIFS